MVALGPAVFTGSEVDGAAGSVEFAAESVGVAGSGSDGVASGLVAEASPVEVAGALAAGAVDWSEPADGVSALVAASLSPAGWSGVDAWAGVAVAWAWAAVASCAGAAVVALGASSASASCGDATATSENASPALIAAHLWPSFPDM